MKMEPRGSTGVVGFPRVVVIGRRNRRVESARRDGRRTEGPTNPPAPISIGLDGYILFNEPDLFPRSTAGVRGLELISP